MSPQGRIEINPKVMLGKLVIGGTRITVEHALPSSKRTMLWYRPYEIEVRDRSRVSRAAISGKKSHW